MDMNDLLPVVRLTWDELKVLPEFRDMPYHSAVGFKWKRNLAANIGVPSRPYWVQGEITHISVEYRQTIKWSRIVVRPPVGNRFPTLRTGQHAEV